ncbi:MAG: LysM peptidoglycan-binding domain-containing protein [Zetaproteobacteria bacterium]|nr:MAG: LysM peptidoglycan-binding domain-containing protein [Zetaproteobacteria bacterium]
MRKLIIALVVASASLVPGLASSQATATAAASMNDLQADAPSEYTVQKGDTLWAISGKFLKEPWKWPQIWQMNRDQIKNPHLIYPGDIIRLDRSGAYPSLSLIAGGAIPADAVVRLEPRTRVQPLSTAVPTIPGSAIGPFLTQPLIVDPGVMDTLPRIVATEEERVIVGAGNTAYVMGLRPGDAVNWQIFRPGETLTDPGTGEVLGFEAIHVGDARVKRFGSPSTIEVTRARQEINQNDRLMPAREATFPSFVPRAPDKPIKGKILSVRGSVSDIAQYSIVAINRGSRDGVEVGHVLATMRSGEHLSGARSARPPVIADLFPNFSAMTFEVTPNSPVPDTVVAGQDPQAVNTTAGPFRSFKLPDERSGLLIVFRTFEKISYGMILKSVRPISVGDVVQTP